MGVGVKKLLCCLFVFLVGMHHSFAQPANLSFYIVAHPDDWQLFMGVNAFDDIMASSQHSDQKVVLIYTTAGDSKCNTDSINITYYTARQNAANHSVEFCANICGKPAKSVSSVVNIHGITNHNIMRSRCKNVISYFLRLPDGCFESSRQSLTRFAARSIPTLSAVDSSTTYVSQQDLVKTIETIIAAESDSAASITINTSDWDNTTNPKDHPDHFETGKIATAIASKIPCVNLNLFEGYCTNQKRGNLSHADVAKESALLGRLSFFLTHNGHRSEWEPQVYNGHSDYSSRNYFRRFITCDSGLSKHIDDEGSFFADSATELNRYFVKSFPNPAKTFINITYEIMNDSWVSAIIYDIYGRQRGIVVNDQKPAGVYTHHYNIEHLEAGIYTIYIKTLQNIKTLQFAKE